MRTFRYRCVTCGYKFTREYKWIEHVLETARCPQCGEQALKQVPKVNIHYNGKGYTKAVTGGNASSEREEKGNS